MIDNLMVREEWEVWLYEAMMHLHLALLEAALGRPVNVCVEVNTNCLVQNSNTLVYLG